MTVDRKAAHMARRHSQLKSVRKAADEFGMSKSEFHRQLTKKPGNQDMIRQGYTKLPD